MTSRAGSTGFCDLEVLEGVTVEMGTGRGPYRFRDDRGLEWVAVFYNGPAERFGRADRPGQQRVAFFLGQAEGDPACDVAAPEEIPETPSEAWLRSLLEGAKALKAMTKAASSA